MSHLDIFPLADSCLSISLFSPAPCLFYFGFRSCFSLLWGYLSGVWYCSKFARPQEWPLFHFGDDQQVDRHQLLCQLSHSLVVILREPSQPGRANAMTKGGGGVRERHTWYSHINQLNQLLQLRPIWNETHAYFSYMYKRERIYRNPRTRFISVKTEDLK